MTQPETRDAVLARELAALPVPEHRLGFHEELRGRLTARPARRRLLPFAAAGALAAAAAAAALAVGLGTSAETATAAEVRRAVERALGSAGTLTGTLAVRVPGGETRWSVVLDARGNFRMRWVDQPAVLAYSVADRVERISDAGLFTERSGVAPGPPDSQSAAREVRAGLGSVVRALERSGGAVRDVTYRGRPAWLLSAPTQNSGERRETTVDRELGLPVRDVLVRDGVVRFEWRLDAPRIRRSLPDPSLFVLAARPGQERVRYDAGFRRAPLASVADAVGYPPLVPSRLPDGFRLDDVAYARSSRPTGNEQHQNPPSTDVVSLAYRRGLETLVVTTRRVGRDRSAWTDPVSPGDLSRAPEVARLDSGPLAGQRVELVVDPNAPLHLWGIAGGLVVTVTGDLTRDELVEVAASLRAVA